MSIQEIEQAITQLTPQEYDQLRAWLALHGNGMPKGSLVDLAGTIDEADLQTMAHEIEAACESIDLRDW